MLKKLFYFLLIFCFSSLIYSQNFNTPDPFSTKSEYNFELKKRGRIGKISYSKSLNKKYSSRIIYTFSDKVKKKAIKSTFSENSPEDNVKSNIEKDLYLWYDYSFDAYSNYPDGQLREKGPFEHRYESNVQWDDGIAKTMDVLTLGLTKNKTGFLLKDGMWEGWYDSGELRYRSNHVNGKLHGKIDIFFKDGTKKIEAEYSYNNLLFKNEFYLSGYLKSKSLNGKDVQSYKESDKKSVVTGKNYERAFSLVTEKHNSKFGDKAKEITVLSKDNLVSVKNSKGYYEGHYTNFVFSGDYDRIEIAKKTKPNWSYIEYEAHKIYMAFGYSPTPAWYDDMRRQYRVSYTDTTKVDSKWKYKVKCSSGKCEIIK